MSQIKWTATAAAVPGVKKQDLIAFQISATKYRIGRVLSNTSKVLTLDSGGEHYEIDPADYAEVAFPISLSYMKPAAITTAMREEYTQAKLRKLQNPDGDVRTSSKQARPQMPAMPSQPIKQSLMPVAADMVYTAVKSFKGVIVTKTTQHNDGALHVTLECANVSQAQSMFTLRSTGSKFKLINAEVSAIPFGDPVGSGRWTKVRSPEDGTLIAILRPVIAAMQKKAAQKIKSSIHTQSLKSQTIAALPSGSKQQQPTSKKAIETAIKDLETQRDAAVKGFNDKIDALRDSLANLSSMPSGPSGSSQLYGTSKGSVGASVYKKLFSAAFRPTVAKRYPIKVDGSDYTMEVTHIVSNNVQLVDVGPKGSRNRDNQMIAVKGEGVWNVNDMNLPDQYRKYL